MLLVASPPTSPQIEIEGFIRETCKKGFARCKIRSDDKQYRNTIRNITNLHNFHLNDWFWTLLQCLRKMGEFNAFWNKELCEFMHFVKLKSTFGLWTCSRFDGISFKNFSSRFCIVFLILKNLKRFIADANLIIHVPWIFNCSFATECVEGERWAKLIFKIETLFK